jgi:uncharacterized membrane protein YgcG
MAQRLAHRMSEPRAHMIWTMGVFLAIGVTLILQPGRYENTPSYANLLEMMNHSAWGGIYIGAAGLKAVSLWVFRTSKSLFIATHTVSIVLVLVWLVAFVIRYVTDGGTTIVNPVSWSTFLYLVVRSSTMLNAQLEGGRSYGRGGHHVDSRDSGSGDRDDRNPGSPETPPGQGQAG